MQIIQMTGHFQFDPPAITNKHEKQSDWKTTAFITFRGCEMHDYYAWFLRKRFNLALNSPLRDTHVSFINDRLTNEQRSSYAKAKAQYDGRPASVLYSPELIRTNGKHWWIKAESADADRVRDSIGLDKIYMPYHITIGHVNEKQTNQEHSAYILRQIMKFNL